MSDRLTFFFFFLFMNCVLCLEHIYHDQWLFLEEKHVVNVHFELKDDQRL
jgi:hypothetical protein